LQWGLREITYCDRPAVRIPYFDREGTEVAVQFRISLNGGDRFRWRKGDKSCLYGLSKVPERSDYLVIVEGPSDVQTLSLYGIPALGLPGAGNWTAGTRNT